jgi:pyruvate dehydrogenase E1 component
VDRNFIVVATLKALAEEGKIDRNTVGKAITALGIDPAKADPLNS